MQQNKTKQSSLFEYTVLSSRKNLNEKKQSSLGIQFSTYKHTSCKKKQSFLWEYNSPLTNIQHSRRKQSSLCSTQFSTYTKVWTRENSHLFGSTILRLRTYIRTIENSNLFGTAVLSLHKILNKENSNLFGNTFLYLHKILNERK